MVAGGIKNSSGSSERDRFAFIATIFALVKIGLKFKSTLGL